MHRGIPSIVLCATFVASPGMAVQCLAASRAEAHAAPMMRIIGSYVSPYVRKVLACLNLKGLAYEIDPITPFFGNDEYGLLSPLRRIPVLVDGDFSICDSSV